MSTYHPRLAHGAAHVHLQRAALPTLDIAGRITLVRRYRDIRCRVLLTSSIGFSFCLGLCSLSCAVFLFSDRVRHDRRISLCAFFGFLALYSLSELIWASPIPQSSPWIAWPALAVPFLGGPALLWIANTGSSKPTALALPRAILHLIPFLLCLALTKPNGTMYFYYIWDVPFLNWKIDGHIQQTVRLLLCHTSVLIYFVVSLRILSRRLAVREAFIANRSVAARNQILLAWMMLFAIWGADIADLVLRRAGFTQEQLADGASATIVLLRMLSFFLLGTVALTMISRDRFVQDAIPEQAAEDLDATKPQAFDLDFAEEIVRRANELMLRDKLYLDPLFSLGAFASKLRVRPAMLSSILNAYLGDGFFGYVNKYRIDEAKRLILADQERSVSEIGYEVGFNSRSTFYTAFRNVTGTTPASYRSQARSDLPAVRDRQDPAPSAG